jgi:hypothetical protein
MYIKFFFNKVFLNFKICIKYKANFVVISLKICKQNILIFFLRYMVNKVKISLKFYL